MSSEEKLSEVFRQMRREDAERKVAIHIATESLREKLQPIREKYGEVAPLVDVIETLVQHVAGLQMDVQRLFEIHSVNAEKENRVLDKLDAALDTA